MLPQPDDCSCGPTCLHALYRYYGDEMPLARVIEEIPQLEEGGTLAVLLGCHALERGYSATLYTYNLQMFDPTWFPGDPSLLKERLRAQRDAKKNPKLRFASRGYLRFLDLGGTILLEDLTIPLICRHLERGAPILSGCSATFLYRTAREIGREGEPDDIRGEPAGHFIILKGYDKEAREVQIADPLHINPVARGTEYAIEIERVLCSILLGIVTYDANMLIIEPTSTLGNRD